jgi:uncharacterized protein
MDLTLFVDHQCNLRCSYCYTGEKRTRAMSVETMQKAVALAVALVIRSPGQFLDVSFFGGEPLLRKELLLTTISHAEATIARLGAPRPRLRFVLNTNGTLVDDEIARALAPPRVSGVFVSLDGDRATHDAHRRDAGGHGSFDAAVRGIERLRAHGVQVQLVGVVSPDTARALGRTVRALAPLAPRKILLAPNLRATWDDAAIADLRAGLREAGDAWTGWFRDGHAVVLEPLHSKVLSHLTGGMPCPVRCQLGASELAVAPSGRIYPCAQMIGEDADHALVIGHVDVGVDMEAARSLQRAKDAVETTCAPCALRDRCQSHCGCRHVALTGRLGEITAALCETERAFIDEADRVAEALFEERCPTFMAQYYERTWRPAGALTELRRPRREGTGEPDP